MAKFSSKSTDWLNRLETVNRLLKADPNRTGVSLAGELKVSPAHASYLMTLNGCLDQAAIDKINQGATLPVPQRGAGYRLKFDGKMPSPRGFSLNPVILFCPLFVWQSSTRGANFSYILKLVHPKLVSLADSSSESAQYNHGPQLVTVSLKR